MSVIANVRVKFWYTVGAVQTQVTVDGLYKYLDAANTVPGIMASFSTEGSTAKFEYNTVTLETKLTFDNLSEARACTTVTVDKFQILSPFTSKELVIPASGRRCTINIGATSGTIKAPTGTTSSFLK